MFIHSRLTQHVSGIIMPIVRRTDCIKPRMVLAWMCWLRLCGVGTRAERTVLSARVPTPHIRSQHIQANTIRGFIQSVLLTMGMMMPETCWVNLLWINIYTCVICWFFLLLLCFQFIAHGTAIFRNTHNSSNWDPRITRHFCGKYAC